MISKREAELWEEFKSRLKRWASVQRVCTGNEKAIYRSAVTAWSIHEEFRTVTHTYIAQSEIKKISDQIERLEGTIVAGEKLEQEAVQALKDLREYLDLVTWGRVRQARGECRAF